MSIAAERPRRHGHHWHPTEIQQLRREAKDGISIDEIALLHERTVVAIELTMVKYGIAHPKCLVINGKNYDRILGKARVALHFLVDLHAELPR